MDVCLINNHMPHFSFMSHIYCYTTAGIAWLPQQHKKMLEQTCITGTDNEVCNFYHSSRSWKYQDFFIKTKTKTKTFISRPRPRPFFMSSRSLETKTKVSRLHPWLLRGTLVVGVSQTLRRWTEGATYIRQGGHHVGHWLTF